jgi:hypothetical protein
MFKSSKKKKGNQTSTTETPVEGESFVMTEPTIETPVAEASVEVLQVEAPVETPVVTETPVEAPVVTETPVEAPVIATPVELPTMVIEPVAVSAPVLQPRTNPRNRAELVAIRQAQREAANAKLIADAAPIVEPPVAVVTETAPVTATTEGPWVALKMTEGAWNRVQRRDKLNSGEIKK